MHAGVAPGRHESKQACSRRQPACSASAVRPRPQLPRTLDLVLLPGREGVGDLRNIRAEGPPAGRDGGRLQVIVRFAAPSVRSMQIVQRAVLCHAGGTGQRGKREVLQRVE